MGGWEGFQRNTVLRISAAAPVPVQGEEVFSVKNTFGILVTERTNTRQACVSAGERKGEEGSASGVCACLFARGGYGPARPGRPLPL